ncbi:hypothetical protein NKR19_g3651 [Coniochaeta hoffmannii]|uniref:Uncharacterized protein n=1 Tax=Coniochaeta hoffmannii TaxID=91930 RepID=A0AA38VR81_9PEZI|nr:hypothetical protein NKR19_g3651 [Coniochaeta hoffmannii]
MDQLNPKANQAVLRPFFRRPGLVILGTAVAGFVAGFKYKASSYERNELAQRNSGPYVSVDRSGGGI